MGLLRRETFVPQSYSWAQEAQVGWYEAWADLDGQRRGIPPGLFGRDTAGISRGTRARLRVQKHAGQRGPGARSRRRCLIAQQRNFVLVGWTGTGKTHLAMAITRRCIRAGSPGRFFNTVDLVDRLGAEGRSGRQGRLADYLRRLDFVILDEP